jgi:eukaryotic-like serine/threonine-protein kinase
MTTVPEALKAGVLIADRYRLEERVGFGGMGEVWRAYDTKLDWVVALKQARVPEAWRGIAQEGRNTIRVQHPNVVTLYTVVEHDAQDWLVMEYVPTSLSDLLQERRTLSPRRAARIGGQLAAALAAINAKGFVHCDVKPGNVLITDDGTAKVIDFGMARAVTDTSPALGGTPGYRAPEVAAGEPATPASDVYSLGATVFAAIEGRPPRGAGEVHGRYGALGSVLARLLSGNPAHRPKVAWAGEMLLAAASGVSLRRRQQIAALAVACLALLVVLLPVSAGDAVPVDRPAGAMAVGNPRTADPCSLLDPHSLSRFGSTSLDTADGNFNRCDVVVDSGRGEVDVRAQFDLASTEGWSSDPISRVDGFDVVRLPVEDEDCVRLVRLPGRYMVAIDADVWDGHPGNLCAMANTATTVALTALAAGPLPRRPTPPHSSLYWPTACSMLDAKALTATPGVTAASQEPGYASWSCSWQSSVSDLWVELDFDHNNTLIDDSSEQAVRIAGRRAALMPGYEDRETCSVRLVNRQITDNHGDPTLELVYLQVHGSQSMRALCRMGRELAASAAGELPAV